jgi:hypothetical protein
MVMVERQRSDLAISIICALIHLYLFNKLQVEYGPYEEISRTDETGSYTYDNRAFNHKSNDNSDQQVNIKKHIYVKI